MFRSGFWLTVFATWALGAGAARATTYELRVVYIRDTPTEHTTREEILRKINRVNRLFESAGISFRPVIEDRIDPIAAAITNRDSPGVVELLEEAKADPSRITLWLIEGSNDRCWAHSPRGLPTWDRGAYALFCFTQYNGAQYAHELGHYFCLRHTHTMQDPVTHGTPDHDGDGLAQTHDDPGPYETSWGTLSEADTGPGRDWCEFSDIPHGYGDVVLESIGSEGMALRRGCVLDACVRSTSADPVPIAYTPLLENGMSYYQDCRGPWTADGVRHEFFVAEQESRMAQCIADEPERAALVDVCAGDADSDNDGLCDAQDPCPLRPNLVGLDTDEDGDGIVDGCDACQGHPGNGTDTDADGYCDAIDIDDDNDLCEDYSDRDPLSDTMVVGRTVGDRPECSGPVHAWTGDLGPDGVRICHKRFDQDIDDDGIPDARDRCPLVHGLGCIRPVSCPQAPPVWRQVCALGGCNELELILARVSNPADVLARADFRIVDGVMYAQPASGMTLLETARTFAGAEPPGAEGHAAALRSKRELATRSDALRFSIRRKRDGATVATMFEGPSAAIRLGRPVHGAVLALRTDDAARWLSVDVSWGTAIAPGAAVTDADHDRIFDARDNCRTVANTDQHDADGDGYGNACDPDLDNDGRASTRDLALLRARLGSVADRPYAAVDEGEGVDVFAGPPTSAAYDAVADLDSDGDVDTDDEQRWSTQRLGPSAYR